VWWRDGPWMHEGRRSWGRRLWVHERGNAVGVWGFRRMRGATRLGHWYRAHERGGVVGASGFERTRVATRDGGAGFGAHERGDGAGVWNSGCT
jgi:hypothetical protein